MSTLALALALTGFYTASASAERPNTVTFTCTSATYSFSGFPNAENNTVTEKVTLDGTKKILYNGTFSFNGPTGSNTVPINVPGGTHTVTAFSEWKTNGYNGEINPIKEELTCPLADPKYSIEKRQEIAGSGGGFTTAPLWAHLGQTVDYEIIVKNIGNVPLTFNNFTDLHCDAGTIAGGPGNSPLAPEASTIYTCDHVLTVSTAYKNSASVKGKPPEGDGSPITHTSNTVVVNVRPNTATFTCTSVTFSFSGFPNANNNTVTEKVWLDESKNIIYKGTFTFNGPTGSNTVAITVPPGHHKITAEAEWKTNGYNGETAKINSELNCSAEPRFSIEKLQEMAGGGGFAFTTSPLTGTVGQTVDYEIIVKNTGNVPLTFSSFTDPNCDEGTIAGGPGESALAPGASSTYTCDHVLTEADQSAGSYTNTASDTGTPPEGDGSPITQNSNTVVVEVP